jgi:hypothetical protein
MDTSGDLKTGSPAFGAKDQYTFSLQVLDTTRFAGVVTRQPNLYSKTLARRVQQAELFYSVDISVQNPADASQQRTVGRWVGTVPIDSMTTGAYELAGGGAVQSPLRITVSPAGRAAGFQDFFKGRLVGRIENKQSLAEYTYSRIIGGRNLSHRVSKCDPMRFESVVLAKGPTQAFPATIVSGSLDFDYETSNWHCNNLRFAYTLDGVEREDFLTGTIRWVQSPGRAVDGQGYYDFNIRFNEQAEPMDASVANLSDIQAFFAVNDAVPALTGRISYIDTMQDDLVAASKVTYNLHANKLTRQQVMAFFKVWMLGIGPINDE